MRAEQGAGCLLIKQKCDLFRSGFAREHQRLRIVDNGAKYPDGGIRYEFRKRITGIIHGRGDAGRCQQNIRQQEIVAKVEPCGCELGAGYRHHGAETPVVVLPLHDAHRLVLTQIGKYEREGVVVKPVKEPGTAWDTAREKGKPFSPADEVVDDRLFYVLANTNIKTAGGDHRAIRTHPG